MKDCPSFHLAGGGLFRAQYRQGFTLLEMCLVLLIMALLACIALPAIGTAFNEKALRDDSGEVALMVRQAMLQSQEQHQVYFIDINARAISLRSKSRAVAIDSDESEVYTFAHDNRILVPDPDQPSGWRDMPQSVWMFQPDELCALPRVRMTRDNAWVEISFNALTGHVENETSYFP